MTKGTSHLVWATIIATVVVTIAIAIYVIAGQKPPVATGDVLAVWAHPQHTETSGLDANGAPMPKENFDQVMVFTEVRLHNQSKFPLFLNNVLTNATLDDGIHSSYAATKADYDRVFLAYPDMPVPHGAAFAARHGARSRADGGGTFVSAFRMTKQQWDARKNLDFTFTFRYQPNLVLTPHVPITEQ